MTSRAKLLMAMAMAMAMASSCVPALIDGPHDARAVIPEYFDTAATEESDDAAAIGVKDWRDYFASKTLQALIEEALKNNQELNISLQELVVARAEASASWAELFPKLGAWLSGGVEKVGHDTSQGRADEATGVPEHLPDFQFGLNASWEVDVWGKLRAASSAADTRYLRSVEVRHFIVTQIIAELARSVYELAAIDAQLDIVQRNVLLLDDAIDVVNAQKAAGRVSQLGVQRFVAERQKNRAKVFALQQQRALTENRINVLVGRAPRHIDGEPALLAQALPTELRTGLPADVLKNRPDVRAAALKLQASKFDVESAFASFFPALSIDASLGYRAFDITHLVATPQSLIYDVVGALVAPLINRPAIEARYVTADALQVQAVYEYEQTMVQAYTDVVNQLQTFQLLQQGAAATEAQVTTLQESVEVSTTLFQAARADYLEVLLTRREAIDAELELVEVQKRVWLSTVDLYQALGGGWRQREKDPIPRRE